MSAPSPGAAARAQSGPSLAAPLWAAINRRLLAKTLSELAHEEALAPIAQGRDGGRSHFLLPLACGVRYRFAGTRRIWGHVAVAPETIIREADGIASPAEDCLQFVLDARAELDMTDATLCGFLQELSHTLMADAAIAAGNAGLSAADMVALPPDRLQCRLDGHPKATVSKGRLGWGYDDLLAYAPEFETPLQLVWIAAERARCRVAYAEGLSENDLLGEALSEEERAGFAAALRARGIEREEMAILPVHPWQWSNMILPLFAGEIAAGRIVPLGVAGDPFLPQISLRTLANLTRPRALHLKLALSILNTSAFRGIPGRFIDIGPRLSAWLARLVAEDPLLRAAGVIVLREVAGIFYPHPHYAQVPEGPYRFHEMLGAIWRESEQARIAPGETAILFSALHQRDGAGRPLICEYIARSGLSAAEWLRRLFTAVTVPLYHLLCRHGVAPIAHGQNVTLVLRDHVPVRVALKDFQGDLDLVALDLPELAHLDADIRAILPRKPPEVIVHNIQTAHFVTALRFVSDLLVENGVPELVFYGVLAEVLRGYQAAHPELAARFALFDLFAPTIPRVCINRVRLAQGYGDAASRPLPLVGRIPLANPLALAETAQAGERRHVS